MRASATWLENQQYDTLSDSGHHVVLDSGAEHVAGPSPMECVLMSLCACTSVEVVSILRKKREPFTSLTVSAVALQLEKAPRVFTDIQLTYRVGGGVSVKAMEDAVSLSQNKYCSVSRMLERVVHVQSVIEYADKAEGS